MRAPSTTLLCFVLLFSVRANGTIRHVPSEYPTIQSAIGAAATGDTVLVAPGTYAENLNFRGKNIVVASQFILAGDRSLIRGTVINGGSPTHPDTASCVLIVSGESQGAVLEGFTLAGGRGTRWLDEHGAGIFREGGGILITLASPIVRNNVIIDNEAVNSAGSASAGGGGIRVGDGAPQILNNVIAGNRGMYGAGIVLNYCSGAVIRNNIIAGNEVYQAVPGAPTYGGGGIWILLRRPGFTTQNIIENNTIVSNSSFGSGSSTAGRGGGVVFQNADVVARNNIVWANRQAFGGAINGAMPLTYSIIEGGFPGTGNISANPAFADTAFQLSLSSPGIDAGDPAASFNDVEDPLNPGAALWPSLGTVRNDAGAYGGPNRTVLYAPWTPGLFLPSTALDFGLVYPGSTTTLALPVQNGGSAILTLDSVSIAGTGGGLTAGGPFPRSVRSGLTDSITISWLADSSTLLRDTLLLYHNDPSLNNPQRVSLVGSSVPTARLVMSTAEYNFGSVDVNIPERDSTFMVYNRGTGEDSVDVSILYNNVQPPSALAVSPTSFRIAAGDSQLVRFTFYPPLIIRVGLGIYTPAVIAASRLTPGMPQFQKTMRFRIVGTVDVQEEVLAAMTSELFQSYPNPFNASTVVSFQLHALTKVTIKVYDLLGREVSTLVVGEVMGEGVQNVRFDAGSLPSGLYFFRLRAGDFVRTRKALLLR